MAPSQRMSQSGSGYSVVGVAVVVVLLDTDVVTEVVVATIVVEELVVDMVVAVVIVVGVSGLQQKSSIFWQSSPVRIIDSHALVSSVLQNFSSAPH